MNILAIDTSTKYFSLTIGSADKILTSFYEPLGRDLSRLILPVIVKQLKIAKLAISEIDCFAVGLGPGSFTGLRIGISTIKGFCLGLSKPVAGIVSLDTLALGIEGSGQGELICPIMDAKRALVYSAIYTYAKNGLKLKSRYFLVPIKELLKNFKPGDKAVFLGDGLPLYRLEIEKKLGIRASFLEEEFWYPWPANLYNLAREKIAKKSWTDAQKIVPLYLYPKECQVKNSV